MPATRSRKSFPILRASIYPPSSPPTGWTGARSTSCSADCRTAPLTPRSPSSRKVSKSSTCRRTSDCAIPELYAEWYGGEHLRAETSEGRRLRPDRALSRQDQECARSLPAPDAIQLPCCSLCCRWSRRSSSSRRHHHRCEVGRVRCRPYAQAEHPVLRNGRGALALRHRQSSPCAGNRAGAWARRTLCRDRQFHAASRADVARRALHLLRAACPAKRRLPICAAL